MAIRWHWAFGPETITTLTTHAKFTQAGGGGFPTNVAADLYTYTGSPTRYSWYFNSNQALCLPPEATSGIDRGWVSFPAKANAASGIASSRILAVGPAVFTNNAVEIRATGLPNQLTLYMGGVLQGSTAVLDLTQWKYLALKFDLSTATHSAELFINGSSELGPFTRAGTASPSPRVELWGPWNTLQNWFVGQVLIYDDLADAGEQILFVTRVPPNADGTDVGTWTPSTGVTDWEVVDPPLDVTTYSECLAITAGDRLEVETNGGGSDLATALGITPPSIDSVLQHAYVVSASGLGLPWDGHAAVELGGSETAGSTLTIPSGSTTYLYALANTRPGGGAWAGTDAPSLRIEAD